MSGLRCGLGLGWGFRLPGFAVVYQRRRPAVLRGALAHLDSRPGTGRAELVAFLFRWLRAKMRPDTGPAVTITASYCAVRRQVPVFRCAPCRRPKISTDYWRDDPAGRPGSLTRQRAISGSQKTRDRALTLAPQGLSYARAGQLADCVKSAIGKWLRRTPLTAPQFAAADADADAAAGPLTLGLRHMVTGQTRQRTIIYLSPRAFGAANRELRRRGQQRTEDHAGRRDCV